MVFIGRIRAALKARVGRIVAAKVAEGGCEGKAKDKKRREGM